MRVGVALCKRQRGRDWYPWVIVSLDELVELAGFKSYMSARTGQLEPDHGSLNRAVRRLERAGLLVTETIPGVVDGKDKRRATVYRLGPAVRGAELPPHAGAELPPHADVLPIRKGVEIAPPLPSETTSPSGIGERTAALTGGPPPIASSSASIAPHRWRDLLRAFNPVKHGGQNA